MRQQTNAEQLAEFYRHIGAAIWHVQYLEDVLVNFLTMKIIHERRCVGDTIGDRQELLADKRRMTVGPLIESCGKRKIIRPEHSPRFKSFRLERHWLAHRSLVENGDDLYPTSTRNAVFGRIAAIQEKAISLRKIVAQDLEVWAAAHGVDLETAQRQAEEAVRNVKAT